jgi:hypothetical protein
MLLENERRSDYSLWGGKKQSYAHQKNKIKDEKKCQNKLKKNKRIKNKIKTNA